MDVGQARTRTRRYLALNAYLRNSGYHEAAWRVGDGDPRRVLDPDYVVELARIAERGILDAIFLPDSPGIAEFRAEYLPSTSFDPIDTLAYCAAHTEAIGLIATASTTYGQPWDLARRLATLDVMSRGRAGWNVVTTIEAASAANFGSELHPDAASRYRRAREFVEVAFKLWDAWTPEAVVVSRETGIWADLDKVTPPRHKGEHFAVSSFLPFPRSPQGRPLIAQAGTSSDGRHFAASIADAVFTPLADIDSARRFREELRNDALKAGRDPNAVLVLPGLSFTIAETDESAEELHRSLEAASSAEFRWKNFANLAGIDYRDLDPDEPLPQRFLDGPPATSFAAALVNIARNHAGSFREVAQLLSALPGGLDFTGTALGLADLISDWFIGGACDGFTLMPNVLPDQLVRFVNEVVPILQSRGYARTRYEGSTLREHLELPLPIR